LVEDPGSGKNLSRIPDQPRVQKAPDPQHWIVHKHTYSPATDGNHMADSSYSLNAPCMVEYGTCCVSYNGICFLLCEVPLLQYHHHRSLTCIFNQNNVSLKVLSSEIDPAKDRLSEDGGWADLKKNLRASLFNMTTCPMSLISDRSISLDSTFKHIPI
jgi:hypothetical protein